MAYLLKQKGFTDVTILEKSNRVGGMVEHVDLRGTRITFHIWNDRYYQKTLIPLLKKFGFASDFVNVSKDDTEGHQKMTQLGLQSDGRSHS